MNTKKIDKPNVEMSLLFGDLKADETFTKADKKHLFVRMKHGNPRGNSYCLSTGYSADFEDDFPVVRADIHPIEWWEK